MTLGTVYLSPLCYTAKRVYKTTYYPNLQKYHIDLDILSNETAGPPL